MALARRIGAIPLALAFGLLSVPLVAVSLHQGGPEWQQKLVGAPLLSWQDALILALGSVAAASLIGGFLGGSLVRTRPVAAVVVAIAAAWPLGIGTLSVTAAVFGIDLRTGIYCIDACNATITSENALSGFSGYLTSVVYGSFLIVGPILALALALAGRWAAKRGRTAVAVVFLVGSYGALHLMSVLYSGIAFACLAVGVMIWATVLRVTESEPLQPTSAEVPILP